MRQWNPGSGSPAAAHGGQARLTPGGAGDHAPLAWIGLEAAVCEPLGGAVGDKQLLSRQDMPEGSEFGASVASNPHVDVDCPGGTMVDHGDRPQDQEGLGHVVIRRVVAPDGEDVI
eukprot:CAMPEP_0175801654 /NCGR_PEP_ID=MMETSP0097-20121207/87641_1 /TAXON_ID=311494 /ORGANISM="Alexandrium monilatum, Strain CCMP3105" /LENGTH=115 /DNA_ID=CAMNT_0017112975 /DNA_START=23 /DNA_END=371 /DNA_ORIENTATION=+